MRWVDFLLGFDFSYSPCLILFVAVVVPRTDLGWVSQGTQRSVAGRGWTTTVRCEEEGSLSTERALTHLTPPALLYIAMVGQVTTHNSILFIVFFSGYRKF